MLAEVAPKLRAEDQLKELTGDPVDDDRFFDLCELAYGNEVAQEAMRSRLISRGPTL